MVYEQDFHKSDLFNRALNALNSEDGRDSQYLKDIYVGGPEKAGKLAFVFPGQGSQYLGMGRDFVCTFPQAMKVLEDVNEKFESPTLLTDLIYPPTTPTAVSGTTPSWSASRAASTRNAAIQSPGATP